MNLRHPGACPWAIVFATKRTKPKETIMFRSTMPVLFIAALLTVPALAQDVIAGKTTKAQPVATEGGADADAKAGAKTGIDADAGAKTGIDADAGAKAPKPQIDSTRRPAPATEETAIDAETKPSQMDSDQTASKGGTGGPANLCYLELSASDVGLTAFVHGSEPGYVGIVLLSLSSDTMHFLVGLPPLLAESAVMGVGFGNGNGDMWLKVPFSQFQQDHPLFGQALTLGEMGLSVSGIAHLGAQ
jgi:hypothetical protein